MQKSTTLGKETTKDLYWGTGSLQSSEKLFKKHQSYEVPVGEHKTYYENGKVSSIQNYNDKGEREGITQFHDERTGKLVVEDNYKNDKLVAHKDKDVF